MQPFALAVDILEVFLLAGGICPSGPVSIPGLAIFSLLFLVRVVTIPVLELIYLFTPLASYSRFLRDDWTTSSPTLLRPTTQFRLASLLFLRRPGLSQG